MIFSMMMGGGTDYGLDYGNLSAKYPSKTFAELNTIRSANYTIVKNLLESGETFRMLGNRLEVYIPNNSTRIKGTSISILGKSKSTSKIVCYPFVPEYTNSANTPPRVFIEPRYGDTHSLRNVTLLTDYQPLYETYACILKFGGTANAIKILGSVRDDFWSEMTVGKNVFYGWTFSVQGQANTIASVDEANSIIYLNNNISASVGSDTQGANVNFGVYFKSDISESDYTTYGRPWLVNSIETYLINGVPAAQSGTDYTINLTNCAFENAVAHLSLSMGSMKVNVFGQVEFTNGVTSFSMFARSYAGGQRLTVDASAVLTVQNTGSILAGAVKQLEPSGNYGSGGYLHDSIIVKCHGQLRLLNNTSASWRQYSSSYGPATGDFSYYADIYERNSSEYGMLMSNTMPTVIDYIDARGQILMRHDTTINGGVVNSVSFQGTDFGIGDRSCAISDLEFLGAQNNFQKYKNLQLTDCTYTIKLFSEVQVLILPGSITQINGGLIVNGGSVAPGSQGTSLLSNNFINYWNELQLTIDGLAWQDASLNHYLITMNGNQSPYSELQQDILLQNMEVNSLLALDGYSSAGSISNTIRGENVVLKNPFYSQHAGEGFVQNIQGITGTAVKSIVASQTYNKVGANTNILEIDFSHDVYETNGTINAIYATSAGVTPSVANPVYGRNITLRAVGGAITLKTFDASLRPTSNIIGSNDTIIAEGNELVLTIDRGHVFMTGTTATNETVGTGNGVKTNFSGVLTKFILDPDNVITVEAGAISVNADANGIFNDPNVVGLVDVYTGKYQVIFTNPVSNTVPVKIYFNYPNVWKNTGAWII